VLTLTPVLKCPECNAEIGRDQFRTRSPWKCPGCGCPLKFSRNYKNISGWITLAISMGLSYIVGLRGFLLWIGGVVMFFPVGLIVRVPLSWIIKTRLERCYPDGEESHFTSLSIDETDSSARPKQP
jgi:hypothetical protein